MTMYRTLCKLPRLLLPMALLGLFVQNVTALESSDVKVHGFFSQAAVVSEKVNVRGDSTHGSFDFSEVGIGLSLPLSSNIRFAAQGVSVKTGADKSAEPEIDFLQVDWALYDTASANGGLRFGKVRLPNGLHYPARDVATVRPGIFMPQSVYIDNLGSRAFLYSTEGAQLYLNVFTDTRGWEFITHYVTEQEVSERVELAALRRALPGNYEYSHGLFVGARTHSFGTNFSHSLTHGWIDVDYERTPTDSVNSSYIDYVETVYSLQYTLERFKFTSEVSRRSIALGLDSSFAIREDRYVSLGAYLETRFYIGESIEWFLRYDEINQQTGDRRGVERSKKTGLPRYYSFARDTGIGGQYKFGNGISLLAELHYVDGLESADASDNADFLSGELSRYWHYASVMLAYRF